jgi:hypothetical protein
MIDKLSLTIHRPPDTTFLESNGTIIESSRDKFYKYTCPLDKCVAFYRPHKFSDEVNFSIPYTKIDINPKNFVCFGEFEAYLKIIFNDSELEIESFNISRIDIAADIDSITVEKLLSIMNVKHIRSESFQVYRGTIYAGNDPKVRIYNKVREIKYRKKKGYEITEYEKGLLDSGKYWTRFEIQIRSVRKNLKEIADDPISLSSYFDRLEFIKTNGEETHGIMQFIYRLINRKFRKQIEELKDSDLIEKIKATYKSNVIDWFSGKEPF